MILRARSRTTPLSIRMFRDALVISLLHKHPVYLSEPIEAGGEVYREIREAKEGEYRTLWEIVAEGDWEATLLRRGARFSRAKEGNTQRYTWRLPLGQEKEGQEGGNEQGGRGPQGG